MRRLPTFEDYLKEQHADGYEGTKDNMSDDFEGWLGEVGTDNLTQYGDQYGKVVTREMCRRAKSIVDDLLAQGYNFDALQEFLVRYNHELI